MILLRVSWNQNDFILSICPTAWPLRCTSHFWGVTWIQNFNLLISFLLLLCWSFTLDCSFMYLKNSVHTGQGVIPRYGGEGRGVHILPVFVIMKRENCTLPKSRPFSFSYNNELSYLVYEIHIYILSAFPMKNQSDVWFLYFFLKVF